MAAPSVTYTFTNGTTASATEVNQNFTDIINGLTDGTEDLTVSALTVGGTATFNGNVTLGNATADDITITGSLAATINIKTNNSFDIGSASFGLASVYLGAPSSRSTRLRANQSLSASHTLTLPDGGGTANYLMKTDGSGNLSFVQPHLFVVQSKTTTYIALLTDDVVLCSTSGGAWTLTLPTAVGISGKKLKVKKTTADFTVLTIDGNGAETIAENGAGTATTTIDTIGEELEIVSDGSNWVVLARTIPAVTNTYTPTGGHTTNVTYTARWWRERGHLRVQARINFSGATDAATTLYMTIPSGLIIDTTKVIDTTAQQGNFGTINLIVNATNNSITGATVYKSTTEVQFKGGTAVGVWSTTVPTTIANGDNFAIDFKVPVSGWKE